MNHRTSCHRLTGRSAQRGVVLIVALIALVAMTMAGLALMRSVDTGLVIAGNLAFKQATTQGGDAGTETAIGWLQANAGAGLDADIAASGYYATSKRLMGALPAPGCDLTADATSANGVNWLDENGAATNPGNANCNMTAVAVPGVSMAAGYTASYVINRMCELPGTPTTSVCASFMDSSSAPGSGSTKGGGHYGSTPLSAGAREYYRITTRVLGPRGTVSFVQAIVAL